MKRGAGDMKRYLLYLFFLMCMQAAKGQPVVGVVDYLKVSDPATFVSLQEKLLKIHEEEKKAGAIVGWALFQVMYSTEEAPYNYIAIRWYPSFSTINDKINESAVKAAYPAMTTDEWELMESQMAELADRVNQGVFYQRITCLPDKLDHRGKVYLIHEIHVKPSNSKKYVALCEKYYKPLYQEDIRNGHRTTWSLWEKWPGDTRDYEYIAADGYLDSDQIDHSNFMAYFEKIHPGADPGQISKSIDKLRVLSNNEMWKIIFRIN